jgi:dehydrogenase/reductase SDR family protein 7B
VHFRIQIMHQPSYYSNKTIWVTGASSGIGEQIALQVAPFCAKLVISARREAELKRVKDLCPDPSKVFIVPLDLSDESSVKAAFEKVMAELGSVDILFNNGGISQRGYALETPTEVERKIFEVNFFSNILLTKLVAPDMRKRKSGHIVVTSTLLGKWGFHTRSAYSASKHALHGYYESLRMEIENDGVFISIAMPGFIATDISKHAVDHTGQGTGEMDANQAGGISAKDCVCQLLDQVASKKTEFAIGGKEIKGLLVKRFFPKLFEKILRKRSPR